MTEPLESARDAIRRIHRAAVAHRDDSLHEAANEVTHAALAMGYQLGPVEDYRPCPICDAQPGEQCIKKPGYELVGEVHPERSQDPNRR